MSVREAHLPEDAEHVSRLVGDYLLQTEREKAEHALAAVVEDGSLPERYRVEVDDPATAFATATVLLAERDGTPVGVVVVVPHADATSGEIKRFWVDPAHRGVGAGGALLEAALARVDGTARLSVWRWRQDAMATYARSGFVEVPTWETRDELVCMERSAPLGGAAGPVDRRPVAARRHPVRRIAKRILVVALVVVGLLVASVMVTEKVRSVAAGDIEEILSTVPGTVDVSYSNDPFSTGTRFMVRLHLGAGASMTQVSDALVDATERWRTSPLADDGVQTDVMIFDESGTLDLGRWDFTDAQLVENVTYWGQLRDAMTSPVSIRFDSGRSGLGGTVTADLPAATASTGLVDRIEQATRIAPPASSTWTWDITARAGVADGAQPHDLMSLDGPPSAEALDLFRAAAAVPPGGLGAPYLSVRTGRADEPSTTLTAAFRPDKPADSAPEPVLEPFVDGPSWAAATAYADLVEHAGPEVRLALGANRQTLASLAPGTCDTDPTPVQRTVEDALLAHLGTTRADYC